jgi:hypothetical protein
VELRARPTGHRHASSNAVSVAELIIRCSEREYVARPQADYGPETTISVAALLRREGRGPHAADRPLKPRGHSRPAPEHPGPSRRSVRKAAVAAGALFAAGAVFSTAVVDTVASPRGDFDLATDPGGLSAGAGPVDRVRDPAPSRPDRKLALTTVAEQFVPIPSDGPGPGTQAGRDVDPFGEQGAGQAIGSGLTKASGSGSAPAADTVPPSALYTVTTYGPAVPGESRILTLLLPDVRTPTVEIPGRVGLNLPVVGLVATPQIALAEGRIRAPEVSLSRSRDGGVEVEVSDIAVIAPDVEATEVTAQLSRTVTDTARIAGGDVLPRDDAPRRARSGGDGTKAGSLDGPLGDARAALRDVVVDEGTPAPTLGVPAPRTERADKADRSERGNGERTGRDRVRKAAESAGSAVGRLLGRR